MEPTLWKHRKGMMLALAAVCMIMAGLLLCYYKFRPASTKGGKEIFVEVVYEDASAQSYIINTDGEYLEQAFADSDELTVEGSHTRQFGLLIETVNGVTAIYDQNQAYWSIELEGENCNYGASQQPIRDGEHYRLVYTAVGTP